MKAKSILILQMRDIRELPLVVRCHRIFIVMFEDGLKMLRKVFSNFIASSRPLVVHRII
jgi:hypothetical protein